MVRQIILVVLALSGFVKVESLQCYRCSGTLQQCNHEGAAKQADNCPTEQSSCLSMAMNDESGMHFVYGCANAVDCKAAMYACAEVRKNNPQSTCDATCCDSNNCAKTYPKDKPLQCYECSSEKECEMAKLSPCSGNQTHCFKITTKVEHKDTKVELKSYSKGCTTKALCEKKSSNFFSCSDEEDCQMDCCDTNYCNAGTNSVLSAFTFLACAVFTFARL